MNIQGGLSGGYIRNAGLGSLPKIVNSYAQLVSHLAFWSFRDNYSSYRLFASKPYRLVCFALFVSISGLVI